MWLLTRCWPVMAQGTYDAAISSITITADRQKAMLFSDPYFDAGQIITGESTTPQ